MVMLHETVWAASVGVTVAENCRRDLVV